MNVLDEPPVAGGNKDFTMIAAISPISGFMNLGPVMPVSLTGLIGASLAPAPLIGAALPDVGTIVSLAGATNVPLTYTATGTFRTSLQITPGATPPTTGTPGTGITRVHLEFDADLDLLIVRDRASAATPLSQLPPDTISRLANAITTDLLLASLGSSSGTTANFASSMLSGIFGGSGLFGGSSAFGNNGIGLFNTNPLFGNTLNVNATGTTTATPVTTAITGTATTNLTLTIGTPTAAATVAPVATATAVTAPLAAATTAVATPVTATPVVAAAPTAAVAIAPTPAAAASPGGAAAADTALQGFLTDAAARALDTISNNPTYAAAAAALYASVAVVRNQNEVTALAVPGRDDAVRQINPIVAVSSSIA